MAFRYLKNNDKLYEPNKVALEMMPMGIIMFLTMSGLIGNNTAFCFLFIGLYVGRIEKDKIEYDARQKENAENGESPALNGENA